MAPSDDEVIASSVAARLRAEGFGVELAHDGPGGVALCDRVRPDLVVLDLMLPGLDGLEVCRRVQRDRAVPVLMLTGDRSPRHLHERLDAVQAVLPDTRRVTMHGQGHTAERSAPARVAEIVARFVDETDPARSR